MHPAHHAQSPLSGSASAAWPRPADEARRRAIAWRLLLALFAAALALSATLMFSVELMFAKMALPPLGGSPAVWNTCVVFFQATMLAAYLYAHVLTTRMGLRAQIVVHLSLLAMAVLALPIGLPQQWVPPVDRTPIPWLLGALLLVLGAPFFVIAATAPLLQRWFSATGHPSAGDPYFLYAASNFGSLVGLASYPVLIEPYLPLSEQSVLWSLGFLALAAITGACALTASGDFTTRAASPAVPAPEDREPLLWMTRARWLALSAVPASLLLAVTTYLSTDIAAAPLLWTVPLALYLLSFVIAFLPKPPIPAPLVLRAFPLLLVPLTLGMIVGASGPVLLIGSLHLVVFFLCACLLHRQLSESRPPVQHLTRFYAWIAIGGLAGGAFNTFVAPLVFTAVVEYPAALVLACALLTWPGQGALRVTRGDLVLPCAVGGTVAAVALLFNEPKMDPRLALVLSAPAAIWCFSFSRRPLRFALGVAALFLAGGLWNIESGTSVHAERSFFGTLRVRASADPARHTLWHGTTIHGSQSTDAALRYEPLTYYHRTGPIGQLFDAIAPALDRANIGIVGLGVGSLAAYAQPSQRWTFYEVDPAVERLARDPRFFTHLSDCGGACRVVLGDARLSLANRPDTRHDLLVLDAFSSDAIPVHLITREALALYWSRMSTDGVMAFHISNRHLDLRPVLAALAAERGYVALFQTHRMQGDVLRNSSQWAVMARTAASLGPIAHDARWVPAGPDDARAARVWTDEFSNVLAVLRTGGPS